MPSKFDKHFQNTKKKESEAVTMEPQKIIQVGEGLLSQASIQQAKEMQSIFVLPTEIDKADENRGISINKIEELAASILDVGLINSLVVRLKEDGRYKIVAGERRFTAIEKLIEENKWAKDRVIKCSLFEPNLIDLPLSDEDKEEYVRATENAEQRDKTDGDKLLLMRKLKNLYEKLREQGLYRGVETRELLATDMGIGKSTVAQLQKVENRGSEELKNAMIDGAVNLTAAVDIASMEKQKQDELISQVLNSGKAEITKKDIKRFQFEEKNNTDKTSAEKETEQLSKEPEEDSSSSEDMNMVIVTEKSLKQEMKDIFAYLKKNDGVKIHQDDLLTVMNKIRDIDKILRKYE